MFLTPTKGKTPEVNESSEAKKSFSKEKFDIALSRIGDEIDKDQKEQDEMQLT